MITGALASGFVLSYTLTRWLAMLSALFSTQSSEAATLTAMAEINVTLEELRGAIRNVPDFPEEGIQFKDITPVLADARLLDGCISHLLGEHKAGSVDLVAGIDARGFIFGAVMARELGVGFVPIRKKGKLPWQTIEESYELEYGNNTIAIHTDAISADQRVLLVDDLLATGGTAAAAASLVAKAGGQVVEAVFFVELGFLDGLAKMGSVPVRSLVVY